jgi:hypothetical protein
MTEQCLQQELAESKLEVQRLRERLSLGTPTIPTVHKDMSLISLIPKWSRSETAIPLEEFISSLEGTARIGRWQESDTLEVALLKITDSAKLFYNGCPELHTKDTTWQTFKNAFRKRFQDVCSDQYHFTNLQSTRQRRNESPQEFADRCRALAQRIVCKIDDPLAQKIHQENADRMLLSSVVSGLSGIRGRQVRYANPQTMEQALMIALSVQQAEKQERTSESFYMQSDDSGRLPSYSLEQKCHEGSKPRRSAEVMHTAQHSRSQRYTASRIAKSDTRKA